MHEHSSVSPWVSTCMYYPAQD